jgi:hypothetical protein
MHLDADCYLTFNVNHQEHYYETLKAAGAASGRSVNVHSTSHGGGVAWEFAIEEVEIEKGRMCTRARIFDGAYPAFTQVPELFRVLARQRPHRIEDVVAILLGVGAMDTTTRTDPAEEGAQP